MIRGNSKTSASGEAPFARRVPWLVALLLYGFAAGGDFAYHLLEDLRTGDQVIEVSEIAVAYSAALFWPVDLIARFLLAPP
jgi:hypothetical protein